MYDRTSIATTDEQPWQALLDSAGEGIWGVDLEGNCTFVNRSALAMLGYESPEELVGKNMHRMVHHHYPDGRDYPPQDCSVYNVFRQNHPFKNQPDHVFRKDGSLFYAEMSAQPIVHQGKTHGAVVTFRDITNARLAEEALRRSEKLAAVGQLASSIAHEINNPLEAVINLLYLIRTAESAEDILTYATLAEQELARISDITMQTLRFHQRQTASTAVDLHEMIPAVLRLYGSRFAAHKVEVKLRLRATPEAMLLEGDLRQVLNNLIRNAYDAMPKGGKLHVRLRPARCPITSIPGVRISVADTGTGFLPKMKKHLFEPFHTSKEITGTGLGLWISKGIIDKHRGRIKMRSRLQEVSPESHGTLFSLWLPLNHEAPMAA
jgi:PAS domain S-box-containing protein